MKATITVKMDNAAFTDAPALEIELARILRELAKKLEHAPLDFDFIKERDINGNTVAELRIIGKKARN